MRNRYFDVLKAIAIIAVVLYHLGTCEYGYLGVDIFLVIAGFLRLKVLKNKRLVRVGICGSLKTEYSAFGRFCYWLV